LLQSGDYAGAAALAARALPSLRGRLPYEAYAEYDLGAALVGLGRCDEALPHLDRSQQLQGHRKEIDQARKQCKHRG
jgi:Flp pilus assembly protein TadD